MVRMRGPVLFMDNVSSAEEEQAQLCSWLGALAKMCRVDQQLRKQRKCIQGEISNLGDHSVPEDAEQP